MNENCFKYTSPVDGKARIIPLIIKNSEISRPDLATMFVNMLMENEGTDYVKGVMKRRVDIIIDNKPAFRWLPEHKTWIGLK
jgi:hypothetical protein